ncbi:hypothetical protein FGSG_11404 [Fusarium graminearum PH-1]|uniref:hypothetical protein n=1 Tax=Gibberella zeae (strain ATCC MYA-4620 / CBS 123657 / FGSC 9075 / NRRL 31084 / PH-1) TaxID=229533 RepID=UPI00021F17B5|nr:hypothetical protein FGSG_11404 [Fusarium graminearum PH-1]ESU18206.1 hypothetical protein FGSG_11404 [Fusarium graminearum PH-1]|eukprot:XP_011325828.1 hypothetical protein FGSG_11404 [Fusarium graminearum PH-1]
MSNNNNNNNNNAGDRSSQESVPLIAEAEQVTLSTSPQRRPTRPNFIPLGLLSRMPEAKGKGKPLPTKASLLSPTIILRLLPRHSVLSFAEKGRLRLKSTTMDLLGPLITPELFL